MVIQRIVNLPSSMENPGSDMASSLIPRSSILIYLGLGETEFLELSGDVKENPNQDGR